MINPLPESGDFDRIAEPRPGTAEFRGLARPGAVAFHEFDGRRIPLLRTCAGCDVKFSPNPRERRVRQWCSEACRVRAFRAAHSEYVTRNRGRNASRARALYMPARYEKTCAVCDAHFVAGRKDRKYCSPLCARRAYSSARRYDGRAADLSAERRAREKGAKVSRGRRAAVLDRDRWVCQLCGHVTNRDARYPDWDFAVVDHIVPLAGDGTHEESNWQTAHAFCNALKRDIPVDEFWALYPDLCEVITERIALAA